MDKTRHLKRGNKEKGFTKDNQPSGKAKSDGWKKKALLKEISNQILSGTSKNSLKNLAAFIGVDIEELDVETAMHLKQIEKALKDGDTRAYSAVMDRIKGKPLQAIEVSENTIKTAKYINATKRS